MGNRANVCFRSTSSPDLSPVVYLHWNGGPESVYAFLDELARRGSCNGDPGGYAALFTGVVYEFFSSNGRAGNSSLYLEKSPASAGDFFASSNGCDNGGYLVTVPADTRRPTPFKVERSVYSSEGEGKKMSARAAAKEAAAARADTKYLHITAELRRLHPFTASGSGGPLTPDDVVRQGRALNATPSNGSVWQVGEDLYHLIPAPQGELFERAVWLGRLYSEPAAAPPARSTKRGERKALATTGG